jgi:PEP-CTERM motif
MKKFIAVLFAAMLMFGTLAVANAANVTVGFPSSGTSYSSATNGTGFIPSGGQSAWMWTAGDSISQTFSGTGLSSVSSLSAVGNTFKIDDYLNGSTESVYLYINGIAVGNFTAPDMSGNETVLSVTGGVSFADITGAGTYTLSMVLQNTIPSGQGSIAFLDGGQFDLGGTASAVPEPTTMLLLGLGLAGVAVARKKFKR